MARVPTPEPHADAARERLERVALGSTIRSLRTRKGFTQVALAKRARISQAALSNYERGHRRPAQPVLKRLAKAMGEVNESAILARMLAARGAKARARRPS